MGNRYLLLTLLIPLGSLLHTPASKAAMPPSRSLTLAWNRSASVQVAGYRLYFGSVSQTYTNVTDVGNTNTATIAGLLSGGSYFFAVTAYDAIGLESEFSTELAYTVPSPAVIRLQMSGAASAALTGLGPAGYQYEVQRTEDLQSWTAVGTVTADAKGTFQFADALPPGGGLRCYRLRQTSP